MQHVEYESFSTVCFSCGRYSHVYDIFPYQKLVPKGTTVREIIKFNLLEKEKTNEMLESFGPWILVERKSWKNPMGNEKSMVKILPKQGEGS
ncbi:hypothetical protein J1N35_037947 [Gossypium stocksii]|uniref:Uncharacterized protein n=1 Tax=Gossypium stocksii TaxID=47602 RepID=A0A9D3ZM73_9ROSI|nr:hypothetical protein J1N35_037947 [Gossypium stocksii]